MSFEKATLGAIAAELNAKFSGDENAVISDVSHDSRQAGRGALFAAIRGLTMDGHRFVEDVVRRGAVGVISELKKPENFSGAWLEVKDARAALARAASIVNGNPSHKLKLVGITGTEAIRSPSVLLKNPRLRVVIG